MKVKPRDLQDGDWVLMDIRALIQDPREKFRLNWLGLYIIKTILLVEAMKLMDINEEEYTQYANLDKLDKYYA